MSMSKWVRAQIARVVFSIGALVAATAIGGELFIDLREHETGSKNVEVHYPGDMVLIDLFVTPQGDNARTSDDGLASLLGEFRSSVGGLLGDLRGMPPVALFNAMASSGGTARDLDGDGDLDLGAVDPNSGDGFVFCNSGGVMVTKAPPGGFYLMQARFTARPTALDQSSEVLFALAPVHESYPTAIFQLDGVFCTQRDRPVRVSPLTVRYTGPVPPSGPVQYLSGTIDEHVAVGQETVKPEPGTTLILTAGLSVSQGGVFSTRDDQGRYGPHAVRINDDISGNFGGIIDATSLQIGYGSAGSFHQADGFTNLYGSAVVGTTAGSQGTMLVDGGKIVSRGLLVGSAGTGTLRHTGGTIVADNLIISSTADGRGTYELDGDGRLTTTVWARIGSSASATFFHHGGTSRFEGDLYLGYNPKGELPDTPRGVLEMSGGSLTAGNFYVGYEGIGAVNQVGGQVTVQLLYLKSTADAAGQDTPSSYRLSGGSLAAAAIRLGGAGRGQVIQEGGNLIVAQYMDVSTTTGSARFDLRDGSLTVSAVQIAYPALGARGEVNISGGQATVDRLVTGDKGILRYTGGSLRINKQAAVDGGIDFGGSAVTLVLGDDSFADFSRADFFGSANARIVAGRGSLLSFPAGFDPLEAFAQIESEGLVHIAGQELVIPPAASIHGTGTIIGRVSNAGLISPGYSPGSLTIEGDFEQLPDGALRFEVADTASSQFDAVIVHGIARLSGALEVRLLDGFVPSPSDSFTILTANSLTGTFSNASQHIRLPEGTFDVLYSDTSVTLSNFQAIPEPVGTGLLTVFAGALLARRRRQAIDSPPRSRYGIRPPASGPSAEISSDRCFS